MTGEEADESPPPEPPGPVSLEAARKRVIDVEGWMSDDQVDALHEAAAATPPGGRIVEIGSFRGRSTIVLASGAPLGTDVHAIDPHAGNDRGPREIAGYAAQARSDREAFETNLEVAGVADRVTHHPVPSAAALGRVPEVIDLLFIDGAHRFVPARADLRDWGKRVAPGGRMLVHDAFSSIGVTLALLIQIVWSRSWHYEGRVGSLACYRRAHLGPAGRAMSAARQVGELGWFARNVVIKVLIVLGRRDLARRLGHDGQTWPY